MSDKKYKAYKDWQKLASGILNRILVYTYWRPEVDWGLVEILTETYRLKFGVNLDLDGQDMLDHIHKLSVGDLSEVLTWSYIGDRRTETDVFVMLDRAQKDWEAKVKSQGF